MLQPSTTTAGRTGGARQVRRTNSSCATPTITAAEMREFCLHAIVPDEVAATRSPSTRTRASA